MALRRASLTIERTSSAVTAAFADAGAGGAEDGDVVAVLMSMRDGGADSAKMDSSSS